MSPSIFLLVDSILAYWMDVWAGVWAVGRRGRGRDTSTVGSNLLGSSMMVRWVAPPDNLHWSCTPFDTLGAIRSGSDVGGAWTDE